MKRIAFVGPYRDVSGYGEASRGLMQSIDAHSYFSRFHESPGEGNHILFSMPGKGVSIGPRGRLSTLKGPLRFGAFHSFIKPVQFSPLLCNRSPLIYQYSLNFNEETDYCDKIPDDIDISFQHVNPSLFNIDQVSFKSKINIGYCTHEASKLCAKWVDNCNIYVQHIMVPCVWNKTVFIDSGVTTPISIMPHLFDNQNIAKRIMHADLGTHKKYTTNPCLDMDVIKNRFCFYNILQLSNKKGVDTLIRAYVREFKASENVSLVLKYHINGQPGEDSIAEKYIEDILHSEGVSITSAPKIILLGGIAKSSDIDYLHIACDLFVTASRGEGWCIPAYHAALSGTNPIVPYAGGFLSWATSVATLLKDLGTVSANNIMPGNEAYPEGATLWEVDIDELRSAMRSSFDFADGSKVDLEYRMELSKKSTVALDKFDIRSSEYNLGSEIGKVFHENDCDN